jgi:multicomponent Na+:H+ antiporter subunit D
MVTGVLGAAAQVDLRRLLSFHIISQIGYLLMGLGLFIPAALASAIFFMAHVIFAKSALFLVGGIIERLSGSFDLRKLGGLYRNQPLLAVLFLLPALSLAGLPPLSGFFGKLDLVRACLEIQQYLIVAVSLFVSLLTLYSMTKVWNEAFWKPAPADRHTLTSLTVAESWAMLIPAGALALLSVAMGLFAEPVYALASQAAEQLMNPALYVQVVLGRAP